MAEVGQIIERIERVYGPFERSRFGDTAVDEGHRELVEFLGTISKKDEGDCPACKGWGYIGRKTESGQVVGWTIDEHSPPCPLCNTDGLCPRPKSPPVLGTIKLSPPQGWTVDPEAAGRAFFDAYLEDVRKNLGISLNEDQWPTWETVSQEVRKVHIEKAMAVIKVGLGM